MHLELRTFSFCLSSALSSSDRKSIVDICVSLVLSVKLIQILKSVCRKVAKTKFFRIVRKPEPIFNSGLGLSTSSTRLSSPKINLNRSWSYWAFFFAETAAKAGARKQLFIGAGVGAKFKNFSRIWRRSQIQIPF